MGFLSLIGDDVSYLEALSRISNGKLLARILAHLPSVDLKKMYAMSKHINQVCMRYQMRERLHAGKVFWNNHTVPCRLKEIKEVSITNSSIHVVTETGKVYAQGIDFCGRLGTDTHSPDFIRLDYLPEIKSVSCTETHTAFVSRNGDLYMCGDGEWGVLGDGILYEHVVAIPFRILNIPRVLTASCGENHTGFITYDGDVYMFGDGEYGALGDGDDTDHYSCVPKKIENLEAAKAISLGNQYGGIVSVSGNVYMFGRSHFGELGDGDASDHARPTPFKIQKIPDIDQIACHSLHTVLLSSIGTVWECGNFAGKHICAPTKVDSLPKVVQIACERVYIVVLSAGGHVYVGGNDQNVYSKIDWVPRIQSIACASKRFAMVAASDFNLTLDTLSECT